MARKFHVEGTKTYLFWSIVFLLIGIWAVKDGWFPSPKMIEHVAFNKTLAVLGLSASAVCGYIHLMVK